MKIRTMLISVFCLGSALIGGVHAQADSRETLLNLQQRLEERLRPVLRTVDPEAHVFVTMEPRVEKAKVLPMTPFVVKGLTLNDASGGLRLGKVDVRVLTRKSPLPTEVLTLVRQLSGGFGVEPQIRVEVLPAAMVAVVPSPTPSVVAIKKEKKEIEQPISEKPGGWLVDPRILPATLILLGLLLEVSLLISMATKKRGATSLAGALEAGFGSLASALQSAGGIGADRETKKVEAQETQTAQAQPSRSSLSPEHGLGAMPDSSLLALLTDCYWASTSVADAYAAFVWRGIPIARRSGLMESWPALSGYVQWVAGLEPIDLGHDQDPYYLRPFTVSHLSNEALTELVRQSPPLLRRLPLLRAHSLSLSARERLTLATQKLSEGLMSLPDFSSSPASELRVLPNRLNIQIKSIDEERELLSMPDLGHEEREAIATLGWLAQADPAKIEEVLRDFSARDLASAWIGPEEVLARLNDALPAKKRDLVQSYLGQIKPSRESETFKRLHQVSIAQAPAVTAGLPPELDSIVAA